MEPSTESVETIERRRERVFWYCCLCLVVVSPVVLLHAVRVDDGLQWRMPNIIQIFLGFFPGLILIMLLEALLSKLQGRPLRFWHKNLTVFSERRLPIAAATCTGELLLRLGTKGFLANASTDARRIDFQKKAAVSVADFADHAFSGDVEVTPDGSATNVRLRLTFQDTIIVETGEAAKMRDMAADLCGLEVPQPAKTMQLLLTAGMADGFICLLALLVPYFRNEGITWLQSIGLGAIGVSIAGMVEIHRRPAQLFGMRLGVFAIYLGLTPFIAILWKRFF